MEYIKGINRNQISLPVSLEELICEENPVPVMDAFADLLNKKELGFEQDKPTVTSRPSYAPRILRKPWP